MTFLNQFHKEVTDSRIAAIANELERLCAVHEAQLGDSQADVSRFETEQRAAEQLAKANGYWIPMMDVFDLGVPGPSGNENDTYVAEKVIFTSQRACPPVTCRDS